MVAEKLRNASGEAKEALSRPGHYHTAAGNLQVKEVCVGEGARPQRSVVCFNSEAEERDQQVRACNTGCRAWFRMLIGRRRRPPALAPVACARNESSLSQEGNFRDFWARESTCRRRHRCLRFWWVRE